MRIGAAIDYFWRRGPFWPTTTKHGAGSGARLMVRYAAGLAATKPWFAIGGTKRPGWGGRMEPAPAASWSAARLPMPPIGAAARVWQQTRRVTD